MYSFTNLFEKKVLLISIKNLFFLATAVLCLKIQIFIVLNPNSLKKHALCPTCIVWFLSGTCNTQQSIICCLIRAKIYLTKCVFYLNKKFIYSTIYSKINYYSQAFISIFGSKN